MVSFPQSSRVRWRIKACPRCQGDLHDDDTVQSYDEDGNLHIEHRWSCLQCGYEKPTEKEMIEKAKLEERMKKFESDSDSRHIGTHINTFKESEYEEQVKKISAREKLIDGKIYHKAD